MKKVIAGVAAAGALAISLGTAGPVFADNKGKGNEKGGGHTTITICHKIGTGFKFMDTPDDNALQGHLGHGDYLASSPADCPTGPVVPNPRGPVKPVPLTPPGKGLDSDAPGIVPPPHAEPTPVIPKAPVKSETSYPAPPVKPNVPANGIPAAPLADPEAPPVVDEELAYTGAAEDALLLWGAAGIGALLFGVGSVVYARRKN